MPVNGLEWDVREQLWSEEAKFDDYCLNRVQNVKRAVGRW